MRTKRDRDRAGTLAFIVYETVARSLRVGFGALADNGDGLTENQETQCWVSALACCDGTSERIRSHISADEILSQLKLSPEAFQLLASDTSFDVDDDPFADNDDWSRAA